MVRFYTRRGCTSCTKAKAALAEAFGASAIEERDFFKRPLSEPELRELAQAVGGPRALFSYRSPSVKALGLDPAAMDDEALFAAMAAEPRLIRRPVAIAGGRAVVGFDAPALARLSSAPGGDATPRVGDATASSGEAAASSGEAPAPSRDAVGSGA